MRRAGGEAVEAVGEVPALDVPVTMTMTHATNSTGPPDPESRQNGTVQGRRVRSKLSGKRAARTAKTARPPPGPPSSPPAAQAQAAPHRQLDELVGEADQAEAGDQQQHQRAGGGHRIAGRAVPGGVAGAATPR